MKRTTIGYLIIIILAIDALTGFLLTYPIEQDPSYHNFGDGKEYLWATDRVNISKCD